MLAFTFWLPNTVSFVLPPPFFFFPRKHASHSPEIWSWEQKTWLAEVHKILWFSCKGEKISLVMVDRQKAAVSLGDRDHNSEFTNQNAPSQIGPNFFIALLLTGRMEILVFICPCLPVRLRWFPSQGQVRAEVSVQGTGVDASAFPVLYLNGENSELNLEDPSWTPVPWTWNMLSQELQKVIISKYGNLLILLLLFPLWARRVEEGKGKLLSGYRWLWSMVCSSWWVGDTVLKQKHCLPFGSTSGNSKNWMQKNRELDGSFCSV